VPASTSLFKADRFLGTDLQEVSSGSWSGDDGGEVTPVPIPNTEVKLSSADGSWGQRPCESRTLPGLKIKYSAIAQR
jgi:hypothetical protein